jgi:hypothetical protein
MRMRDLESAVFNATVEKEFAFLLENGFRVPQGGRTDTSLTAGVQFIGRHVAVEVNLDRRDECVDCLVSRVEMGKIKENDEPGGYWGHLHGFLVKRRGYRGSFKEFRPENKNREAYVLEIAMYANALRSLTPDIANDSDGVFD